MHKKDPELKIFGKWEDFEMLKQIKYEKLKNPIKYYSQNSSLEDIVKFGEMRLFTIYICLFENNYHKFIRISTKNSPELAAFSDRFSIDLETIE